RAGLVDCPAETVARTWRARLRRARHDPSAHKRASKDKGAASGSERDGGPGASEERSAAQPREHRTGPRDLKFHGDERRAAGGAVGVEVVEWAALPRDDEDGRGARPVGGEVETETPGAAGIERGGMVGEYEAETTDERGDVTVRREGGTCGREALVRGGDAGAGRIVQVEVGEEVQPRRQRLHAQRTVTCGARNEGLASVGHEEVTGVVAAWGFGAQGRGRRSRAGGAAQLEAEEPARAARRIGEGTALAVQHADHEARLREPEPGASRRQVEAPNGPDRGLTEERWGRRGAGEVLVAIGRHDQRMRREHPVKDGERTHPSKPSGNAHRSKGR